MKRILYSCLLFALAHLTHQTYAQTFTVAVSNSVQCFSASGNTMYAEVVAPCPFVTNYSWVVTGAPVGCTPTVLYVAPSGLATNGSSVSLVYPPGCCGFYTIEVVGSNTNIPQVICGPGGGVPGATVVTQVLC